MQKSIRISGLSTNPNDYNCGDENLASAINVYHEMDSITPVGKTAPKLLSNMNKDVVIFRHSNQDYRHLIVRLSDNTYGWIDESELNEGSLYNVTMFGEELSGATIMAVEQVNSILVFSTNNGMRYYRWKNNSQYIYLGEHIPELKMRFGLEGHFYSNHASETGVGSYDDGAFDVFSSDNFAYGYCTEVDTGSILDLLGSKDVQKKLIDGNLAEANMFVSATSKEGYFSQPFLVRYAYRMFDGSHTMLSAPILMRPSSGNNPIVTVQRFESNMSHSDTSVFLAAQGIACKLLYILEEKELDDWKDLIAGVDVFASAPAYTYKQDNPKYKSLVFMPSQNKESFPVNIKSIFKINGDGKKNTNYNYIGGTITALRRSQNLTMAAEGQLKKVGNDYYASSILAVEADAYSCNLKYGTSFALYSELDTYSDAEIEQTLKDCGTFYLIKEYALDELKVSTDGEVVDIKKDLLNSLVTQEVLEEDYDSHHGVSCGIMTCYNGRLNTSDIDKRYFNGFSFGEMTQKNESSSDSSKGTCSFMSVTRIDDDGRDIVKCSEITTGVSENAAVSYLFYPDTNARYIDLYYTKSSVVYKKTYALKEHNFLNGSYYIGNINDFGLGDEEATAYTSLQAVKEDVSKDVNVHISNEIRTSEVNNPFVILAKNVESVGNGKVIDLVPQAEALSIGQFGEFPMIAFTTDGLWALSVNETGGWAAKQPFSRDVVLNEDKGNILQLDKQIMFATNRGLMMVSGSNVECISEVFDGIKDAFDVYTSSAIHLSSNQFSRFKLIPLTDIATVRSDVGNDSMFHEFNEFIADAAFLYDYTHQRIIVGNSAYPFSFVYNIKDKLWTSIAQRISSSVNSYPNCYAMTLLNGCQRCDVKTTTIWSDVLPPLYSSFTQDDPYYNAIVKATGNNTAEEFRTKYGSIYVSRNGAAESVYPYGSEFRLTEGYTMFRYSDGKGHEEKLKITYSRTQTTTLSNQNLETYDVTDTEHVDLYAFVERDKETSTSYFFKMMLNGVAAPDPTTASGVYWGNTYAEALNNSIGKITSKKCNLDSDFVFQKNSADVYLVFVFFREDGYTYYAQNYVKLSNNIETKHNTTSIPYSQRSVDAPSVEVTENDESGVRIKLTAGGLTAEEFAETYSGMRCAESLESFNNTSTLVGYGTEIMVSPGSTRYYGYFSNDNTLVSRISKVAISEVEELESTNALVDFAATDGNAQKVCLPTNGLVMTRPLKLDAPDALKTVTKVIARGKMKPTSVDMVLLGSRDLSNYVVVGSCSGNKLTLHHGTAYKYFRVGIITKLESGESLSHIDIEYDIKQDNKMR